MTLWIQTPETRPDKFSSISYSDSELISPDDVVNWYYGNKEQLATIESTVLEDQVFDYIIDQAKVNDKQVSYQDIMEPEPKSDETG